MYKFQAMGVLKYINAGELCVAYEESGDTKGVPVILLHGFPYDIRAYDEVAKNLSTENCRILVPYLRGFGPTTFLSTNSFRSGQQAALANDLLAFMDALFIPRAILAGYDWGGRAACIVAALVHGRVIGLVTVGGYNIQNIPKNVEPADPEIEMLNWYQFYFHSERGRAGLRQNRRALCKLLWRHWSPGWHFDEETYEATAVSFEHPDFVDVVIHSYRHRYGLAIGDPAYETIEQELVKQPRILVPAVVLDADCDGVEPIAGRGKDAGYFQGSYQRKIISGVGHNVPQEAPAEFTKAILSLK